MDSDTRRAGHSRSELERGREVQELPRWLLGLRRPELPTLQEPGRAPIPPVHLTTQVPTTSACLRASLRVARLRQPRSPAPPVRSSWQAAAKSRNRPTVRGWGYVTSRTRCRLGPAASRQEVGLTVTFGCGIRRIQGYHARRFVSPNGVSAIHRLRSPSVAISPATRPPDTSKHIDWTFQPWMRFVAATHKSRRQTQNFPAHSCVLAGVPGNNRGPSGVGRWEL